MNCPTCAAYLKCSDEYERRAAINAEIATAAQECLRESVRQAEIVPELYLPETVARWRKAAGMPNASIARLTFREDSNTRRKCVRKTPCERWFWADACHYPHVCEFARSEDTANKEVDRDE
jgi:hypothetical protein